MKIRSKISRKKTCSSGKRWCFHPTWQGNWAICLRLESVFSPRVITLQQGEKMAPLLR